MKNRIKEIFLAIILMVVIWLVCYLLAALFSWSFDMEDWHFFSKFVFWGPSVVLSFWTINDHIFSSHND